MSSAWHRTGWPRSPRTPPRKCSGRSSAGPRRQGDCTRRPRGPGGTCWLARSIQPGMAGEGGGYSGKGRAAEGSEGCQTNLRQDCGDTCGPEEGALAAHVRTREQQRPRLHRQWTGRGSKAPSTITCSRSSGGGEEGGGRGHHLSQSLGAFDVRDHLAGPLVAGEERPRSEDIADTVEQNRRTQGRGTRARQSALARGNQPLTLTPSTHPTPPLSFETWLMLPPFLSALEPPFLPAPSTCP